ncbi:hypothetical protein ACFLYO_10785 [Chloroflexota bacterium]
MSYRTISHRPVNNAPGINDTFDGPCSRSHAARNAAGSKWSGSAYRTHYSDNLT